MEVHHHSHSSDPDPSTGPGHRGRKKWTHYFWEFIMLFLAVFCGFLAEYQLEHKIEKDREKQYIKSFAEDLTFDISDLVRQIDVCNANVNAADSLLLLLVHQIRLLHWEQIAAQASEIIAVRQQGVIIAHRQLTLQLINHLYPAQH